MSAWLKAGLIGGAILFLVDIIGQIPLICCCAPLLIFVVYIAVGVMDPVQAPQHREPVHCQMLPVDHGIEYHWLEALGAQNS